MEQDYQQLKEDYNELVETMQDPRKYREMLKDELEQELFEVLKKDFISYLKDKGEWPTNASSTRVGVPSISGSGLRSLRESRHRAVHRIPSHRRDSSSK